MSRMLREVHVQKNPHQHIISGAADSLKEHVFRLSLGQAAVRQDFQSIRKQGYERLRQRPVIVDKRIDDSFGYAVDVEQSFVAARTGLGVGYPDILRNQPFFYLIECKNKVDVVEFSIFAENEGEWRNDSDYWVPQAQIRKILLDHGAHRARTLSKMAEFEKWDGVRQKIYHACWHLEAEKLDAFLRENPMPFPDEYRNDLLYTAVVAAPEFTQKFFVDDLAGYEERLIATLNILRKYGCDLDGNDGDALYYAVRNGYVKTAHYLLACGANPDKCHCGYWSDSHDDLPEHRHYYSLADKVLLWRCYWQKETALAFQEMFPLARQ